MSHSDKELYEFGKYRLDVSERLLLRDGRKVTLTDKAFDTLCALVRSGNRLVAKDELMSAVWAGAIVEENNLDKNISALRKILGERADKQKFIETVRGHGYRFVAEVRRIEMSDLNPATGGFSEEKTNIKSKIQDSKLAKSGDAHFQTERQGNVIALAEWKREPDERNITAEENQSVETAVSESGKNIAVVKDANFAIEENGELSRKSKPHRFKSLAAISVVVLAVAGFAFYKFSLQTTARSFEAKKTTRLTSSGRAKIAAISPDGKLVVYSQEEYDGRQSLWMRHIGSEGSAQIASPADVEYHGINVSSDGNSIYYTSEKGTLYRMPVLGGAAKKIADGLFVAPSTSQTNVAVSPDSRQIAFVRRFEKDRTVLFISDADGANQRTLAAFEQPAKIAPTPVWSPDGETIATRIQLEGGLQNIVVVRVADGSNSMVLPENWSVILKMIWLPDSKNFLVVGRGDSLSTQIFRVNRLNGESSRITDGSNNYEDISLNADGRFLTAVRIEQTARVWTTPREDATRARQLTAGFEKFDGITSLNWLPENKIVYDSSPNGELSTWKIEAGGNNPQQIAKDADMESVSPDGSFMVYRKGFAESGDLGLYRMNLSDGEEKLLTDHSGVWTTVSHDGKWVVYTLFGERTGLWKVSTSGGEAKLILDENAICPAVSPDGKTVAFVWRRAEHPNQIALVSANGGEVIKTFDSKLEISPLLNKQKLQWTPDGHGIYFISYNNGASNIWQQPIDGSTPLQVTNFKDGRIFNFAFSTDGKQLALSRGTFNSDVVLIENAE